MTLGEMRARAAIEPPEIRASRRRAVVRRMQHLASRQRERDLVDLRWRDEAPAELQPLIGWRDHGGEG